jgi:hypothetical protein
LVDQVEVELGQKGVVCVETSGERLGELGILERSRRLARSASWAGSRSPAIRAASIARPDTPVMSLATEDS